MRARWLLPIAAVAFASGCSGHEDSAWEGTWRVASLEVDDQPFEIDEPLFMDITTDGFHAATTGNWQSGDFGGEIMSTLMGCVGGNAAEGETYMRQAFDSKPTERDGQLVFENGDVQLVYERYDVPAPVDLFAVLADPTARVDESELPPESATGSVPPNYTALVPVTTSASSTAPRRPWTSGAPSPASQRRKRRRSPSRFTASRWSGWH